MSSHALNQMLARLFYNGEPDTRILRATRSIPSLDGLRALAVGTVLLGHSQSRLLDYIWLEPFRMGALGVACFFVISGFLITSLLIKDIDTSGKIDLRRFYIRRAFRIFPAFYTYLLVIAVLKLGLHYDATPDPIHLGGYLAAATYSWNYVPNPHGWLVSHTWSLSLEEQFYLVWPLCLCLFSPRMCLKVTVAAIALSPIARLVFYVAFPVMRPNLYMMLPTHCDAVMMGCAIALAQRLEVGGKLLQNLARARWLIPVGIYLAADQYLVDRWHGGFIHPIGITLDSLAFGILILHVVSVPGDWLARFLNLGVVAHIGRISYGLYLWQQLFSGPLTRDFPLNLVWILLCAEVSYWCIEQPLLRWRDERYRVADLRGQRLCLP